MPAELLAGTPRIHLVGVGGIGVSALAELFAARGCRVTGTDRNDSVRIQALKALGIEVHVGDDPALAAGADLVIYTSAAKPDHPERKAAGESGVPQFPRGAALAALVRERRGVGVAGAHGKTTTTAILAELFSAIGVDPLAAVGGVVDSWGSPVRTGAGEWFVAEADESDGSFLALDLAVALVLNIDADHLENYADFDALKRAYRDYLAGASERAIVFVDDPHVAAIVDAWDGPENHLVTVSMKGQADLRVGACVPEGAGMRFQAQWLGEDIGSFFLSRPGEHNVGNAACALAVALSAGYSAEELRTGLATVGGVDRRFSDRGRACGVRVIDDYAHMPAEVEATLKAARAAHDGRIVVAFQPHLYSRTKAHARDFAAALALADRAFVLPIYGAREAPVAGVDADLVANAAPGHVEAVPEPDLIGAAHRVTGELRAGDWLLTLGAGSVTALGPEVINELWRRRLAERLGEVCPEHWLDEPLARFNSFQAGGPARVVARPANEAELLGLLEELRGAEMPFKVLGGGTNVLVGDRGYRGAIVILGAGFAGFEVEDVTAGQVTVRAGAGLTTGKLFRRLQKNGVGGFEWFHHVPGTLGGALCNNSGAYGQDLRGHLIEYRLVDSEGGVAWHPAAELQARYRWTSLKYGSGQVVVEARLRGPQRESEEILAEAKRQAAQRNATQPAGRGSVGCAFKNPSGESAGKLIDAAGLKGLRRGAAQVSELHGNFLLNTGGASAADIVGLAEEVRRKVAETSGITLEDEIERVGDF